MKIKHFLFLNEKGKEGDNMETTEIAVVGNVTTGTISFNTDEILAQAKAIRDLYKNMSYSSAVDGETEKEKEKRESDASKMMKSDRAKLNKAKTALKKKLSEVKAEYMKPYTDFDGNIKECITELESARTVLDESVKNYEAEQKAAKKKEICKFFADSVTGMGKDEANSLYLRIYDVSWENSSTSRKKWQEELLTKVQTYQSGMKILSGYTEHKEDGIEWFRQTLDLATSIAKIDEMVKHDAEIIERHKAELEAEAKRKAEAEIAETKRKAEAEIAEVKRKAEVEAAEAKRKAEIEKKAKEAAIEQAKIDAEKAVAERIAKEEIAETKCEIEISTPVSKENKNEVLDIYVHVLAGQIIEAFSTRGEIKIHVFDEDLADPKSIQSFIADNSNKISSEVVDY